MYYSNFLLLKVESPKQDSRPFNVRLPPRTRLPTRTKPTRDRERVLSPERPSLLTRPGLKATKPAIENSSKAKDSSPNISSPFSFNDLLSTKSTTFTPTTTPRKELKVRFTSSTEKSSQTEITPIIKEFSDTSGKKVTQSPDIDLLLNIFETTTVLSYTPKATTIAEEKQTLEKTKFRFTPRPVPSTSSISDSKLTSISTSERVVPKRPFTQKPRKTKPSPPIPIEYEYVYDDYRDNGALGGSLGDLAFLTNKAEIRADGSIECTDTGYFPHPESCKKFISCSKTVRGYLRGWVYTCPQELVFDPVGGMCNWTETVDCLAK